MTPLGTPNRGRIKFYWLLKEDKQNVEDSSAA
jgi:hypothetical protein